MFSLRQILAQHSPLLLIDSCSSLAQVGLFAADRPAAWQTVEADAGTGVFSATEQLLQTSSLKLDKVEAFAFCAGPGSILGVRTAAVALRTWQVIRARPMFGFSSLEVVAQFQKSRRPAQAFSVIADARRDTWHRLSVSAEGRLSPLERVPTSALTDKSDLLMPANFRHWATLPTSVEMVPYALAGMFSQLEDSPLFSANADPDAFLHETPSYLTWQPQIHRAPTA